MCEFCEGGKPIISSIKQFSDRTESAVVMDSQIILSENDY